MSAGDDTVPPAEPNGLRGGAGTGSPLLSRLRVVANAVSVVADEMEEERGSSEAARVGGWSMRLRDVERAAREYDRAAAGPRAGDTAPDGLDEAVHRLRVAYGTGEFIPADVAAVVAELVRLRSDAAALRDAGNELAAAADQVTDGVLSWPHVEGSLIRARETWRSAVGSES